MKEELEKEIKGQSTRDQVKLALSQRAQLPENRSDPFWFRRMLSRYDNGLPLE